MKLVLPTVKLPESIKTKLRRALFFHKKKQYRRAESIYNEILEVDGNHFDALHFKAILYAETDRLDESIACFNKALKINSNIAELYSNCGLAKYKKGAYSEALQDFDKAIKMKHNYSEAYNNRGNCNKALNNLQEAIADYNQAIELNNIYVEAYCNRGSVYRQLKRYKDAECDFYKSISIRPEYVIAYLNLGNLYQELKNLSRAIESYDQAIKLKPNYVEAFNYRGNIHRKLKNYHDALNDFDKAIILNPDYVEAYNSRGVCNAELHHYDEALRDYNRAVNLAPLSSEIYNNRGNTYKDLQLYKEAIKDYNKAIKIQPNFSQVYNNRGICYSEIGYYQKALPDFEKAYELNKRIKYLKGRIYYTKMRLCDWKGINKIYENIRKGIINNELCIVPFSFVVSSDSLFLSKKVAELYVKDKHPLIHQTPLKPTHIIKKKINIGYFSADFHDHATMYLLRKVFEVHDRTKFNIILYSFGLNSDDNYRKDVIRNCYRFNDVRLMSDKDVALLAREQNIDIAIDLKGYTKGYRAGIFAYRAAPIQVSYLGYPGTMGAKYIDYIIADKTVIPEASQKYYSENIVYMPNSYQANDSMREISEHIYTRKELGLPDNGFVFCCFNNNYKYTEEIFYVWMKIIQSVPDSVLWLYVRNAEAKNNLIYEAKRHGVNANKILFADYLPLKDHLSRLKCADMFLDTYPCNAHTTASDALWAGLPVLTIQGETFASRVASSLLTAIGMPELITRTPEAYESLAIELGTNSKKLKKLKKRLKRNRLTTALFDTERYTRHLEQAYTEIYQRYQQGLPSEHIKVPALYD